MKLFVPDIGTLIRLEQDWQVTLYAEHRNRSLFDKLGLPYKTTIIDLPKGLVIKVDRIYIRKGLSQYSSLTFTCPKPKTKKEKELNPKNIDLGGAKFWIKLHECNGLSISNVISNEETVNSIKELYSEIEKEVIENLKDVYKSTSLLQTFNSYLGPGLNINNLHTDLSLDHFLSNMLGRMSKNNEKGKEYFESKFKSYLRDHKLKKILS
jgi:hypothetical protein